MPPSEPRSEWNFGRLLYLLPGLILIGIMGLFGIGLRHDPNLLPSALIDKPMPAFALPALDAGTPALQSAEIVKSGPAIVNFFASWCIPCRIEAPTLAGFAASGAVPIYGIDYKDKSGEAKRFLAETGNPYSAIGADIGGRTGIDFGIYGVPETFLVDRSGHIRYRFPGPLTPDILHNEIVPRLAALSGPK